MQASIWLRVHGEQQRALQNLIESLAAAHGTVPFQPHMTVCGSGDLNPALWDAAAAYVEDSGLLPLAARKIEISYSTTKWSKALVIEIENSDEIRSFREELSRITGAVIAEPPHISLLYTIGGDARPVSWVADEARLRAIAEDCETRINADEFLLDRPVVVAPEGGWQNIRSWKVIRRLSA
jgi:hypothetical protein